MSLLGKVVRCMHLFEVDVVFEGHPIGHGKGKSKKIAEQDAARSAFLKQKNQQKDN